MSRIVGLNVKYKKVLNTEELFKRLENAKKNAYAQDMVTRDIDTQLIQLFELYYKQAVEWENGHLKFMQLLQFNKDDARATKELCQQKLIEVTREKENIKESMKKAQHLKELGEFSESHAKMREEAANEFIELLYKKLDIQANMPL